MALFGLSIFASQTLFHWHLLPFNGCGPIVVGTKCMDKKNTTAHSPEPKPGSIDRFVFYFFSVSILFTKLFEWLMMINLPEQVQRYLQHWKINLFILVWAPVAVGVWSNQSACKASHYVIKYAYWLSFISWMLCSKWDFCSVDWKLVQTYFG